MDNMDITMNISKNMININMHTIMDKVDIININKDVNVNNVLYVSYLCNKITLTKCIAQPQT